MSIFDDYSTAIDTSPIGPIEQAARDRIEAAKIPGIIGGGGASLTNEERDAIEAEKAAHQLARQRAAESPYARQVREANEAHQQRLADGQAAHAARQQAIADQREQARQAELDEAVAFTIAQGDRADEDDLIRSYRLAKSRRPGQL